MSETEQPNVSVNDRRRFDSDGNPRTEIDPLEPHEANEEIVDVQPQPAGEPPRAEPGEPPELVQMRSELEATRKRLDELARAYQALLQDREEYKARLSRERERMIDVEKGNVALGLVEAIDELDLCLNASAHEKSALATGVRLIRESMLAKLSAMGVERFELVGKPFDPNLAEAGDMELTSDPAQDQQVVSEMRAGYRLKGRVVRPARVKVLKYVQPAQA